MPPPDLGPLCFRAAQFETAVFEGRGGDGAGEGGWRMETDIGRGCGSVTVRPKVPQAVASFGGGPVSTDWAEFAGSNDEGVFAGMKYLFAGVLDCWKRANGHRTLDNRQQTSDEAQGERGRRYRTAPQPGHPIYAGLDLASSLIRCRRPKMNTADCLIEVKQRPYRGCAHIDTRRPKC